MCAHKCKRVPKLVNKSWWTEDNVCIFLCVYFPLWLHKVTWPGLHFGVLCMSAGTTACQTHLGHTKINTRTHTHTHTHTQLKTCISLTQSALRWQLKKITLEWKKRRRNWLTYSQLNSCWERGAYLPTTANMSFSIRWKALSLSLIFCSISPGNLFRVGRKKKKKKKRSRTRANRIG